MSTIRLGHFLKTLPFKLKPCQLLTQRQFRIKQRKRCQRIYESATPLEVSTKQYQDYAWKEDEDIHLQRAQISLSRRIRTEKQPQNIITLLTTSSDIINPSIIGNAAISAGLQVCSKQTFKNEEYKQSITNLYEYLLELIEQHVFETDLAVVVGRCMWSLGKAAERLRLHLNNSKFVTVFSNLSHLAGRLRLNMESQTYSQVLWSLAKMQVQQLNYQFNQVLKASIRLNPYDYNWKEVGDIFWAIGMMEFSDIQIVAYYMHSAKLRLEFMEGYAVANVMWCLKRLRYYDIEFMQKVEDLIHRNSWAFTSGQISMILMCFAELGVNFKETIFALLRQIKRNKRFSNQDLANIFYSLAVLQVPIEYTDNIVAKLNALPYPQQIPFKPSHLNQIRRAQFVYSAQGLTINMHQWLVLESSNSLALECQKCAQASNSFLDKVYREISKRYPEAEKRVFIMNGELEVNIGIIVGGTKVCIQTNTQANYMMNSTRKLVGSVVAYCWLLYNLGWQVVSVSNLLWHDQLYQDQFFHLVDQAVSGQDIGIQV
eukprot:TRINITY_DN10181_c0_g1_i3.p1 TRINITY_DN10181_c0_g1~~TRINITY_DN10181_c0_g1_i3.p1  ORF type:complete len:572 (+),score=40.78 TRINITY_DN10181_c0_g1_i3:93-1718(+)